MNANKFRNDINNLWRLKSYVRQGLFVLNDLVSLCGIWRLESLNLDILNAEEKTVIIKRIQLIIDQLPENEPPWTLQFFLKDSPLHRDSNWYAEQPDCPIAQDLQQINSQHIANGSKREFLDNATSGLPYKFRDRCCYCVLYRINKNKNNAEDELRISQFEKDLYDIGLGPQPLSFQQVTDWLSEWLTGKVAETVQIAADSKASAKQSSANSSYGLGVQTLLQGSLLANIPKFVLADNHIRIDPKHQSFRIGKRWHRFLRIVELNHLPSIGLFTAEQSFSQFSRVLWDAFSASEQLCITITAIAQNDIIKQIQTALDMIKGQNSIAQARREICNQALAQLHDGSSVRPVSLGIYTQADSHLGISKRCHSINAMLKNSGLMAIPFEQDTFQTDHWLVHLPANFDYSYDQQWHKKISRLWHSEHISQILPIYGSYCSPQHSLTAAQGTIPLFNRSGQLISIDPLKMKVRNAHSLILGSTGVGKTALLIHLVVQLYARYRPRIYLVSTLPTFDGLIGWLEQHNQSVFQLRLRTGSSSRLSLFSNATQAAHMMDSHQKMAKGSKDLIGEIEVIAELLMTGQGHLEPWEKELLVRCILQAGREKQHDSVLISDVVHQLELLSKSSSVRPIQADKAIQLAATLKRYTWGLAGEIFDQPGTPWPDVDCTLLDLGVSAKKGYEHLRTLAYVSYLSHIHSVVENSQDGRPTLVITDEAHIIISQEALGGYIASLTAQWRTYGAWNWMITQNLRQFGQSAKQILSLTEWWWILSANQDELDNLRRFTDLTPREAELISSCTKLKQKYVEGVLLSDSIRTRFRTIPPKLSMALSLTDPDEKAQIRSLAIKNKLTHTQASILYLEQLTINAGKRV